MRELIYFSGALSHFIKDDRRLVSEIFLDIILLDQTIIFILQTLSGEESRIADTYHQMATNLSILAARTKEENTSLSRFSLFHALKYTTLAMRHDPHNASHQSFYQTLAENYIFSVQNHIKFIFSRAVNKADLLSAKESAEDILKLAREFDKKELLRCVIEVYQTLATYYNAQCRMRTDTLEDRLHYASLVTKQIGYWRTCWQVAREGAIDSSARFFEKQLNQNANFFLANLNRYYSWFEIAREFQNVIEINKARIFCFEVLQKNVELADAYFSMSVAHSELRVTTDISAEKKEYARLSMGYAEKAHVLFPDHAHHAMRLGSAREVYASVLKRTGEFSEAIEYYFRACTVLEPLLARVKDNAELSRLRDENYRVLFYCYNNLFFCYFKLQHENPADIDRTISYFRRGLMMGEQALTLANAAKDLWVSAVAIDPRQYIEAYYFFICYLEKNRPLLALDELTQLIAVCVREGDSDTLVKCYDKQASILMNFNHYEEAIEIFEQVLHLTRTQRRQENITVKNALAACYKYASKDMPDPVKRTDYIRKAEMLFREQRKFRKVGEMLYRQMQYASALGEDEQVLALYPECIKFFLLALEEDLAGDITLKDMTIVAASTTDSLRSIITTIRTTMHQAYFAQDAVFIKNYTYRREAALYATEGFYEKAKDLYVTALRGFYTFATERGMDLRHLGLTEDFLAEISMFATSSDNCAYLDVTARDIEKSIRSKESVKRAFPHLFSQAPGTGFFAPPVSAPVPPPLVVSRGTTP